MGMFDTLQVRGKSELVCGAGHQLTTLQSKDLQDQPAMDLFYLVDGQLYVSQPSSDGTEKFTTRNGVLVRTVSTKLEPYKLHGSVNVYTHCGECAPVCYAEPGTWGGGVGSRYPWAEYQLTFKSGRLTKVKAVSVETRDDLRRDLYSTCKANILDDNSPLVTRHLELVSGGTC